MCHELLRVTINAINFVGDVVSYLMSLHILKRKSINK